MTSEEEFLKWSSNPGCSIFGFRNAPRASYAQEAFTAAFDLQQKKINELEKKLEIAKAELVECCSCSAYEVCTSCEALSKINEV